MDKNLVNKKDTHLVVMALALCSIYFFMLILNYFTPYCIDDFGAAFSKVNGERIKSIWMAWESAVEFTHIGNGRLISTFVTYILTMVPKGLFNVINAGVFTLYIYMCGRFCRFKKNVWIVYIIIFCMTWYFTPAFGEIFLWFAAAVNYLWGTVLTLTFLLPYYQFCLGEELSKEKTIMLVVLGFIVGAWGETMAVAVVCGTPIFLCYAKIIKKRKWNLWMISAWISGILGFVFLMTREAAGIKVSTDIKTMFITCVVNYQVYLKRLVWCWVIFAIILLALTKKLDKVLLSGIFCVIAVGINFSLMFASGYPKRVMLLSLACMFISITQLLGEVVLDMGTRLQQYERYVKYAKCALCAGVLLVSIYYGGRCMVIGTGDIITYGTEVERMHKWVVEQSENGVRDIVVPSCPEYDSKYICYNEYPFFDINFDTYVNVNYMKFYGLEGRVRLGDESQLP